MVDRQDRVRRVVVHDSVETVFPAFAFFFTSSVFKSNMDVESPAFVVNARPAFGAERDAVHSGRVLDVAQDFPGRAVDDHHVRAPRHEDASGCGVGREVVGPASPPILYFSTLYVCENAALGAASQASAVASANTDFLPML